MVRRYPDAVPAGEIAGVLGFKANTTSTYLSILRSAGLIDQRRIGTSLCYQAKLDGLKGMFDTLISDCCQNRPDICNVTQSAPLPMPTAERPLNVLFICTGNSARSILAEALLNGEGDGRFRAYSAGIAPKGYAHEEALSTLVARGYDVSKLSPKGLAPFLRADAPQMDLVITVCNQAANEEPPQLPGQPLHAHWGVANPDADPSSAKTAMRATFEVLKQRIQALTWLPFERLDRQSLQHRIDELGHLTPPQSSPLRGTVG
ncbi:ArsR family transcriptional regulator [Epibacterium ulvae]|uniref:arsenate reductase/protein-tyrosine-phosphatase family protein n=1 Tax=Epibacterium ulvae TaxID=1156985 RepID=UPI00203C4D39